MSSRSLALSVGALAMAAVCVVTHPAVAGAARALVTGADVEDSSLTSADVADASLLATEFAVGQVPRGPVGDQGAAGPTGPAGAPGVLESVQGINFVLRVSEPPRYVRPGFSVLWKVASGVGLDGAAGRGALVTLAGTMNVRDPSIVGLGICVLDAEQTRSLNKPDLSVFEMGPGRRSTYQISILLDDIPSGVHDLYLCVRGLSDDPDGGGWSGAPLTLGGNSTAAGWVAEVDLR